MNLASVPGFLLAPAGAIVLVVAQAGSEVSAALADPTGFGILKLATETIVGVSVLIAVFLFLRRDKEKDAAIRQIADDFRGDVRAIAERFEESQERIVERFEESQEKVIRLTREVVTRTANHDSLLKSLVDRQDKIEMTIYAIHATAPAGTLPPPQEPRQGEGT